MIKNRIILPFSIFFVTILLFNCKNRSHNYNENDSNPTNDSISSWVSSGRDQKSSETDRKDFLIRAYDKARSVEDDSTRLRHLSRIQWSFLNLNDSLWFRKSNSEMNQLAKKEKDSIRIAGSNWDLGIFLDNYGIKDSAYYHFSSAKKLYEAHGNNLNAGKLEYDMARIQVDVKNYIGAEVGTARAIELLKPFDENFMLYRCYNLLGIITKDLEEYHKSLEYYTIAEEYLQKSNAEGDLSRELSNNIGVSYLEIGEYDKASAHFKKILNDDSLQIKNPKSYALTLNNLAQTSYQINPDFDAEKMFLEALSIRKSLDDNEGLAGGFYDLTDYYLFKKDTLKALKSLKKSKVLALESSNNERLLESLELLIQLDPGKAALHGQEYISLNDRLQLEERKIRNKFALIRFETNEVVAENELLARQKQLWTGIALAILLLGTSGYIIITQRLKNQKLRFEREQQVSNEKIFNLMLSEKQKFEEGKKLEQKRISEELHDGVLGKMLGARMVLTGLNKRATQEAIEERADAISALKDVEGEVRSISHELSHAAYQEIHNFIRSIRDLLQNIGDSAGINHNFIYDEEVEWDDLNGNIKINVYRIVQESLQNAVKHSKCENLALNFSEENNELKILIKDDGVGFIMNKTKRKGIGMRNLQSRITKLNGQWQIDSQPGVGTSVKLSIPIDYFSEEPRTLDEPQQVEKV